MKWLFSVKPKIKLSPFLNESSHLYWSRATEGKGSLNGNRDMNVVGRRKDYENKEERAFAKEIAIE